MTGVVSKTLHGITSSLEVPVIIVLLILIATTVVVIGWVIAEYFTEHRHMKIELPKLIDEIRSEESPIADSIENSALLKSQKKALIELTQHKSFNDVMLESLADDFIDEEQAKYDKTLKVTNLIAKLGPIMGLMGTLIPLGPGIIALGQGDTYTLSTSLLMAFDTTIGGLLVAGIAIVISTIRGSWYGRYMSVFETLIDCVLEVEKKA